MTSPRLAPRLRGDAATERAQHVAGLGVVAVLTATAAIGLGVGIPAVATFAVGAGAGYSLSGSV